jgi:hypothetical protein
MEFASPSREAPVESMEIDGIWISLGLFKRWRYFGSLLNAL